LFDNEEFLLALDIYRQMLSVSPEDQHLNYRYGACLIYSDEDTNEPIKYLKYGASSDSDPLAYYYLGKALHLNYQFADAQKAFSSFILKADSKLKEKYSDAELLLEMTKNGQSLLKKIKDIIVLDKTEASEKEFFRSYNLDDIGGKIIVTPAELLSKKDKESGENSLIFFQGAASDIYFSSYGNESQRDIYRVSRLENGKFTKPRKLIGGINTKYDENYPCMHPDGVTLYFSSKGHNSMGGYDIFKSSLDPNTGAFGPAENLDFAVSSPDDDIFYIADLNKDNAYFASGRSSELGRLNVYHVKVRAGVANLVIIKGSYLPGEDNKPVRIRIEDAMTNNEVGAFESDPTTGEYLISLPRSGKYKFYVEEEGENTVHSGLFEIPRTNGNVAYAQEMTFTKINGANQLVLNNLFDKPLEDDITMLMADALKQKAKLDINKDDFDEELTDDTSSIESAYEEAGFSQSSSNETIISDVKTKSDNYARDSKSDLTDAQMLFAYAQMKKDKARTLLTMAKESYEKAKSERVQSLKEENLLESAFNKKMADIESKDALIAMSMLRILDKSSRAKNKRSMALEKNLEILESSLQENDYDKMVSALTEQKELNNNVELPETLELLQEENNEKRRQSIRALEFAQKLEVEEKELSDKLNVRKKQLDSSTKKKERENLELEIIGLKDELADYKIQTEAANKRYETRIIDQTNSEAQGELLEEYKLRIEGDIWSNLEPQEYSKQELTEFDKDMRFAKRESKDIEIGDVDISQILAKREDLSHKFDFGEIVHDSEETLETAEVAQEIVPDDLEFIEESEDPKNLIVISEKIEKEDDYEIFLIDTEKGNDQVIAYDNKINEYNKVKEVATPEEKEILEERISRLTNLKSESVTKIENEVKKNLLADFSEEIKFISEKELLAEDESIVFNWINPTYLDKKSVILHSDKSNEVKQKEYDVLNASFNEDITKSKAELVYLYTIREIAGTARANENLEYLQILENEFAEGQIIPLGEEVAVEDEIANAVVVEDEEASSDTNYEGAQEKSEGNMNLDLAIENSPIDKILNADIDLVNSSDNTDSIDTREESNETVPQENLNIETRDISNEDDIVIPQADSQIDLMAAEQESKSSNNDNQVRETLADDTTEIIIDEVNILTSIEKQDLADKADVSRTTDEHILRINDINNGAQMSSDKVEERLVSNRIYLEHLESKHITEMSNDGELILFLESHNTANEALEKLILSTKLEMDKDRVKLAESNNLKFTQNELSNSRYRTDYIEELAKISASTPDKNDQIKKKVMLHNMIAFDLEKEIENMQAQLILDDISQIQRSSLENKLGEIQKDYDHIRIANKEEIAILNNDISETEMYGRQKLVSYDASGIRNSDYTKLLNDEGYKRTNLNYEEAKIIQQEANQELTALETKRDNIDPQMYMNHEIAIGEKMGEANRLEIQDLDNSIENVNIEAISSKELLTLAKDLLAKAETWKTSVNNLEQLSVNAVGNQKHSLLKDKLASQLNAIEYMRHAKAIINYSKDNSDTNDTYVFTDFVIPNHEIAELNSKPNYDLAEDLFSSDYQFPSYQSEATASNNVNVVDINGEVVSSEEDTSNEILEDENHLTETTPVETGNSTTKIGNENIVEENEIADTSQTAIESSKIIENSLAVEPANEKITELDTLKLLSKSNVTIEDLQEAQIRLNKEDIKQIEPLNSNGVMLSAQRTTLLDNNTEASKGENARAYFKKKGLIDQIKEMSVEQIDLQKQYADIIYTKEQGLIVVKESLEKDGSSEILIKEHNRLVAEIVRLKSLNSVVEKNVLVMNWQLDQEETSLSVLKRNWEEEKALDEFVVDENLSIPNIPDVLLRNVFVKSNSEKAAYTDDNPIPVDLVMPEGIVYQVQVGAYRQPIPQDLFKGFAPIMGQKIQSGITRYKVGLFTSHSNATTARDEIRSLGYTDAFVVVFNGGEKISIAEAQVLTGEEIAALPEGDDNVTAPVSNDAVTVVETVNNVDGNATTVGTGVVDLEDYTFVEDTAKDDYYDDVNAAEAKQVEMIKGLFFTVQIGAYSNPVTADKLQNVSPLNSELTNKGLIRYTSGIYRNINGASDYKQEMVGRGISDAFVSAYYNGFRINLSKARDIIASQGDNILVDENLLRNGDASSISTGLDNTITRSVNSVGTSPNSKEEERPKDEVLDAAYSLIENGMPGQMIWDLLEEEGLLETVEDKDNTFKVILGPFVAAIPTREVEIILNFRDNIRFEERENNVYVYSSINPIPYEEALNLKETLEKEGITTAKIVSFKGDREISLKEYLDELSE
ncbi:MAG: hypothetical protein ACI86P_001408, partial [Flavobacteriales bacterium]